MLCYSLIVFIALWYLCTVVWCTLVANFADPHVMDRAGETVLHWACKRWNGEIGAWKVSHDDSPTVCHKIRLILIRTDTYLTFGMLTYSVQGLCLVQHSHTDCHTALNAHAQHAHIHLQVHAVQKFASISALNVHFPPVSYLIISDKWQWMVHSPAVLHRPILWLLWARWGEPRCPRVLSH